MPLSAFVETIGAIAAVITTLGWLPQVAKVFQSRRAEDISLFANLAIGAGVFLWFIYSLMLGSWPIMLANGITFVLIAALLALKLYFERGLATPASH